MCSLGSSATSQKSRSVSWRTSDFGKLYCPITVSFQGPPQTLGRKREAFYPPHSFLAVNREFGNVRMPAPAACAMKQALVGRTNGCSLYSLNRVSRRRRGSNLTHFNYAPESCSRTFKFFNYGWPQSAPKKRWAARAEIRIPRAPGSSPGTKVVEFQDPGPKV